MFSVKNYRGQERLRLKKENHNFAKLSLVENYQKMVTECL